MEENNKPVVHLISKPDNMLKTIYTAASDVVKQDIISCAFTSTTQIAFAVSREISNYKIYQDDFQGHVFPYRSLLQEVLL